MKKLTEGQRGWLETLAATPHGMMSRLSIPVGHGGSIASLVKLGLAEWRGRSLLSITDAGRAALRSLQTGNAE